MTNCYPMYWFDWAFYGTGMVVFLFAVVLLGGLAIYTFALGVEALLGSKK